MASFDRQKTLILMALPQESQGLFEKSGFQVHFTGVGKVKSTFSAHQLILKLKPDQVLNLGTAGSHRIEPGTLVECHQYLERDPVFSLFPQPPFTSSPVTSLPGVVCGSGDFIQKISEPVGCDVFDMEAYALAYVCTQLKVKFNSLKFVTDRSDKNTSEDWKKNLKNASLQLFDQSEKLLNR